jgi:RNA polymerase-binding transcription factor
MAKKTTPKKRSTVKSKKKFSTKGKNKVAKKKTMKTKQAAKKKKVVRQTSKAAVKKKVVAKKPVAKKASSKRTVKLKATDKTVSVKVPRGRAAKKTAMKKPAISRAEALQKIKGYSKKDLEQFRTIILEKRDEILEDLQSLKEQMLDPTTGEYINENSPYSLHMAEQGTDAMEREKTFLYAQRENKFLAYLDDALKRIDSGTYGICIECIEEPQHLCETCPLVPKARLIAVPHTQHCLPIKQKKSGH